MQTTSHWKHLLTPLAVVFCAAAGHAQDTDPGVKNGAAPLVPPPAVAPAETPPAKVAPPVVPPDPRTIAFKAVLWDISRAGTPLNLDGYKVTFEDNFDTFSVTPDGGKGPWYAPIHTDVGTGKLMPPGPDGPFSVADGILTIKSKKVDGKWQNGMMQTVDSKGQGFAQQYGYFETRARMPVGTGSWAAFWLLTQNGFTDYTKTRGEIDVVEWYGADPKGHHTSVHLWPARQRQPDGPVKHVGKSQYSNFNRWQERFKLDAPPLVEGQLTGWHTYGSEVTKDWVVVYFDRHELARFPTQPEYQNPIYMLVDLIINPPEAKLAISPLEMNVDYVRAYSK